MPNIFLEIAILLSFSTLLGLLAIKLRQPLILVFILAGIILGPSVLGWITSTSEIDLLAKIGITLLLFIVGLKLDLTLIKTLGPVATATGLGQVVFTAVIGYIIGILLGFSQVASVYISVALTFSSTIIIVKLLTDKDEIDSLYGQIAIGFLIVQDIVVIITIIILSSFGIGTHTYSQFETEIILLLSKGIGLLLVVGLLMRYVIPPLLDHFAKSRELLILFAVAWAVFLASTSDYLGFSKEVGGFLAGVSLASTKYKDAIASRLESLRNFLLIFFFLDLGAKLQLSMLTAQLIPAILFSLFVLIGNPLIVMIIMGIMGYRKRTGFLAGLTVAQISEFSLILAALGERLGHIDNEIVGLITLVGLVTIGISTYMIIYSHVIYQYISPWLGMFERRKPYREDAYTVKSQDNIDVVIYGVGRYGYNIAKILQARGFSILAIDFDPQKVAMSSKYNIPIKYGDAEDVDFTKNLPLNHIKWIVSSIPHFGDNKILITSLRENNYQGKIAVCTFYENDYELIKKLNVDMIITPYKDATQAAANALVKILLQERST